MSDEDLQLIDAAKDGDVRRLDELLTRGADIHQRDEHGWTPLAWAAGNGATQAVRLLLERGADVTATGRDNRTPLMIAKAASRDETTAVITEAEKARGVWEDPRETRPYCKAYYLRDLRSFPGWSEPTGPPRSGETDATDASGVGEKPEPLHDDSIVYLHQDLTVTRSMWHGEDLVFDRVSSEWRSFCEQELEFAIPEDLL